jgi:hypothetical protein
MLRCINDGVTTIKRGHQTIGNAWYVRWVVLHDASYIMKGLHSENTEGRIQSRMPGSISETWERFCGGLGSSIMVQYSVGPIITLHGRVAARQYVDVISEQRCSFPRRQCPHSHSWNCTVMVWIAWRWTSASSDLNITEPLWSILETTVRNRFPHPTSLKQLEDDLQEKWYKILLDCSKLVQVHSKEDCSCIEGKRWSNIYIYIYSYIHGLFGK